MAQGIYIDNYARPKSKKSIKDAIAIGSRVLIESTSMFGNEYEGPASDMPEGKVIYFVGPDPYTSRKFYGQIVRRGNKITVS